jgi:hypothetical protein
MPFPTPAFSFGATSDYPTPCQLDQPGLCGQPASAHAEAVATVLDETMSLGFSLLVPAATAMESLTAAGFTSAQLDLWFRKPVLVVSLVLAKAW